MKIFPIIIVCGILFNGSVLFSNSFPISSIDATEEKKDNSFQEKSSDSKTSPLSYIGFVINPSIADPKKGDIAWVCFASALASSHPIKLKLYDGLFISLDLPTVSSLSKNNAVWRPVSVPSLLASYNLFINNEFVPPPRFAKSNAFLSESKMFRARQGDFSFYYEAKALGVTSLTFLLIESVEGKEIVRDTITFTLEIEEGMHDVTPNTFFL